MGLIISALLFSLSSNLDNLVVGIAYGIKKIKIGIVENLAIAFITSIGTLLSMSLGGYLSSFYSHSNCLGAMVIIALGVYFIVQSIRKLAIKTKSKDLALKNITDMMEYAEESDLDSSGDISLKESLLVAFGLSFNNLGTGVAASITGINIQFTVISTFVFSIFTLMLGRIVGNHVLGKYLGKYTPLFSGVFLVILGIIELFN